MLLFSQLPVLSNIVINTPIQTDWMILIYFLGLSFLAILGTVFILKSFLQSSNQKIKAFDKIVLKILVPKERKSEGQNGQAGQDDRLDQIREEIGLTETFFSTIAGLKVQKGLGHFFNGRSDHLACEIVMHNNQIYFYLATPKKFRRLVEEQIHAQYPHAEIEEIADYNIFTDKSKIVGAYLSAKEMLCFPFRTYKNIDSDPLLSILTSLTRIHENNSSAAIQIVIRSANKQWRKSGIKIVHGVKKGKSIEDAKKNSFFAPFWNFFKDGFKESMGVKKDEKEPKKYEPSQREEEMLKGIEEKISKGGLDVTIRILSVSDIEETAKMNLDNLINSFSQYNLYHYGNSYEAIIPRNQSSLIRQFIYRSFSEKRKLLLNTEEMSSLWHLPLHSTEVPNIKWLGGRKAPPPPNLPASGILLGHVVYRGKDVPVHMNQEDRRRHLYTIGKSGSGKSVFLANLAIQDILAGNGICIVDPHGDLVNDVLEHVPKHRVDDVIIFNPSDMDRPIGLNMLEAKTPDQKDFAIQEMIAIFYKLFPPEMIGPMFEHNMRNVMLTLMADLDNPGTIIDIPRMFTDDEYVRKYLKKLTDPVVKAFWEKEMAKTSDFHKSEMLGYLISKVGRFVENDMMRNIMGQQKSGFDFREVMDKKKILLVNLSKGTTGEVNAKLLGLIIVAKLQMAALSRADLPQEERHDFYLYIDEFQNFITDSISTILSEARKYRLDLIVAHQFMGQLIMENGKTEVRDAVLGNAGTICSFRIGPDDAEILAKEFAPTFGAYDLLNVPQFSAYTKLLIDNTASRPFNMQMYPPKRGNRELAAAIKQLSRLKYGRDRAIVEAEILERTQLGASHKSSKDDMIEASL